MKNQIRFAIDAKLHHHCSVVGPLPVALILGITWKYWTLRQLWRVQVDASV